MTASTNRTSRVANRTPPKPPKVAIKLPAVLPSYLKPTKQEFTHARLKDRSSPPTTQSNTHMWREKDSAPSTTQAPTSAGLKQQSIFKARAAACPTPPREHDGTTPRTPPRVYNGTSHSEFRSPPPRVYDGTSRSEVHSPPPRVHDGTSRSEVQWLGDQGVDVSKYDFDLGTSSTPVRQQEMINIRSFDKRGLRDNRIEKHLDSRKTKRDMKVSALRKISQRNAGAAQDGEPGVTAKPSAVSQSPFAQLVSAAEMASPMQLSSPPYQGTSAVASANKGSPMQLSSPSYQGTNAVSSATKGSPMQLSSPSFQVTNAEIETVTSEEPISVEKAQADEDFIDKKRSELLSFYNHAVAGMENDYILPTMSQTSLLDDDIL